eukprot:10762470-Karenia_brevis.AAC.1
MSSSLPSPHKYTPPSSSSRSGKKSRVEVVASSFKDFAGNSTARSSKDAEVSRPPDPDTASRLKMANALWD